MKVCNLIAILLLVTVFNSADARVLLDLGYETGLENDGNSKVGIVEAYPDRIEASQDYARHGSWSLRTRLVYGDTTVFGSRAESDTMGFTKKPIIPGKEKWFGFSLLLPPDFQYDSNGDILFQLKQYGAGPFFSLYTDEGKFMVIYQYDTSGNGDGVVDSVNTVDLCPYEKGIWYDFVLRVIPEWESGNTGVIEFWYKEAKDPSYTQVIDYSGLNLINQKNGYSKWGVYKSTWDTSPTDSDERIVYHDAVAYGTTFSDVDPSDGENYAPCFVSNDYITPVAYYSFDNSSDLAADDSGNGNDLFTNYTTSPSYYASGISGGAGNFNPTNGYDIKLSDTSPAIYPDGSHSVVFWASSHSPSSTMALTMPASLDGGYSIYTSGGYWRAATYGGAGGSLITGDPIVQYQWNHIAYTYEVTSGTGPYTGTGRLYFNGFEVDVDTGMQYLQGGFRFGLCNRAGGTDHYDGVVDEFAVFDTVISSAQVWDMVCTDVPDELTTGKIVEVVAAEGQAYVSTLADNVFDYEGDSLGFSKVSGPAWLTVASDGGLSGTPAAGDVGLNVFQVQVSDAGGNDTATLNINVSAAPYFISNEQIVPVAYYSFDNSSDLAADDSGNGNNLFTNYTTAASSTTGILGGAADFNGTSDGYDIKISDSSPELYVDGSFTVVFWAAPDVSSATMMATMPASLNGGFSVYTSNGTWRATSYDGSSDTINSNVAVAQGEFAHIAYSYEVASGSGPYSGTGRIYVDGVEAISGTMSYSTAGFRFGLGNRGGGSDHFDGVLDEFAIFDTVLSSDHIEGLADTDTPADITTGELVEIDGVAGQAYSATLSDNADDAEGDALTFSKVSGPAWLSVASNGSLSGTPASGDIGLNVFQVQVSDVNGGTDTATLNINVN